MRSHRHTRTTRSPGPDLTRIPAAPQDAVSSAHAHDTVARPRSDPYPRRARVPRPTRAGQKRSTQPNPAARRWGNLSVLILQVPPDRSGFSARGDSWPRKANNACRPACPVHHHLSAPRGAEETSPRRVTRRAVWTRLHSAVRLGVQSRLTTYSTQPSHFMIFSKATI
jgi:hypothetical protein